MTTVATEDEELARARGVEVMSFELASTRGLTELAMVVCAAIWNDVVSAVQIVDEDAVLCVEDEIAVS